MAGWVDEWTSGWVEAWMAARGKHCAPPTPAGAAIHRLILALPLPSIPTSVLPLIALVVAFALASGSSARGAVRARETLDLALEPPQARTNGPMLTQVQFTWTGRGLLEGKLEIELRAGQELLTTYVTPDLALTTGTVRFAMLLPSVATSSPASTPAAGPSGSLPPRGGYRPRLSGAVPSACAWAAGGGRM